MADKVPTFRAGPGPANGELYRGDPLTLRLRLVEKGTTTPVTGLPTTGWSADMKARVGSTVLASFEVDASQAAAGIIYLILAAGVTTDFPARVVYDLQRDDTKKTYVAGTITFSGEVTLG